MRAALWKKNDDFIKSNQNAEFQLGHNKFSDWTEEERKALLTLKDPQRPEVEFVPNDVQDGDYQYEVSPELKGQAAV